ncbi:hypothetical protein SLS58_006655 [Diplodia intermedia]|uniref:Uncharacterized protein n=1 Tax=Diplodia intermedia TaxID=856260 RepID=A0ABR3TN62_9PEZI
MHNILSTTLCLGAAAAGLAAAAPTTVAADGKTFSIWADYSRCSDATALSLQILDFAATSGTADPTASRQTTGEDLVRLTAPFRGSVTLLEPGRMGPYRQQSVTVELFEDGAVSGNATFVPGAKVRSWDLVKWGGGEGEGLWPDEVETTDAVQGTAGSVVTAVKGDSLFLEWCTR